MAPGLRMPSSRVWEKVLDWGWRKPNPCFSFGRPKGHSSPLSVLGFVCLLFVLDSSSIEFLLALNLCDGRNLVSIWFCWVSLNTMQWLILCVSWLGCDAQVFGQILVYMLPRRHFLDMLNTISWLHIKQITLHNVGEPHLIIWRSQRQRPRFPAEGGILPQD